MYKEIIKNSICFVTLLATLYSCNKSESPEAKALYTKAESALLAHNPEVALSMIDSLSKAFPQEIDLQQKAMHLRTLADSALIDKEEALVDSTILADSITFISLQHNFEFIKKEEMVEGYYIHKNLKQNQLFENTGIEPRIDENGNAYIVSSVFGKNCNHTYLTVSTTSRNAKTEIVPYDQNMNYRYSSERGKCEMITFLPNQCSEIYKFIQENSTSSITLTFCGDRNYSTILTSNTTQIISETLSFSKAMQSGRNAIAKRNYLAKKRELNRKQIARTKC